MCENQQKKKKNIKSGTKWFDMTEKGEKCFNNSAVMLKWQNWYFTIDRSCIYSTLHVQHILHS